MSKARKKKNYPIRKGDTISLMPRKKKGLLRIMFSRAGIAAMLILIQMFIIYSLYDLLRDNYQSFAVVLSLFSVLMVLYLFYSDMDSTAKLTWLLLLTILPVPGAIFLLFTEKDIGHRRIKKRIEQLIGDSNGLLKQKKEPLNDPDVQSSGVAALCTYLNETGCFPLYDNTDTKFYPLGDDAFGDMIEDLKHANRYIYMEFFIIDEGEMWGRILKILADKAKKGVDVRVMYDGMCQVALLPSDYRIRLAQLGIKCKPFSPIRPFLSTHYNYRDHRKILVIDGRVAYTGGINLADEYINKRRRFGHWKDTAIRLRGEAVQSFTLMFMQMWSIDEPNLDFSEYLKPTKICRFPSDGFVIPYCDCPLDQYNVGESVYIDILSRAKDYVHIMTPYLILDNELERAIKYAAQRGVDVKLILPGIPDKAAVYALAKSNYSYLTEAGVKIYEYTPGFVHAKIFVSDGEKAVVGTINLDYRSLYHHFECAAFLYKASCIKDIEEDFQATLHKCREVTPETIKHEKLYYKVLGGLMRLAAPLM